MKLRHHKAKTLLFILYICIKRLVEKIKKWKGYIFELVLIFISVWFGFFLSEWSSSEGEKLTENKILTEIRNGIRSDLEDFESNVYGHNLSLQGISAFRGWMVDKPIRKDSLAIYYYVLLRDYIPVINRSGYESLKTSGLKTIINDSLRHQIINLYEFHYKIIDELEDGVQEMKDYDNFFHPVNAILNPYFDYDEKGRIVGITPNRFSEKERKEMMSYLWRVENNKKFKVSQYNIVIEEMKKLEKNITEELKN
ncbi:MAG: hypothetical protein Q4A00_06065 [Flavobacteriaceae bacterium]|nr:hypothetical protein [Flavobacteriaceae bacterium]